MEFNSNVWKTKKEKGISLMKEIAGFLVPRELKLFERDLIAAHKLI